MNDYVQATVKVFFGHEMHRARNVPSSGQLITILPPSNVSRPGASPHPLPFHSPRSLTKHPPPPPNFQNALCTQYIDIKYTH
jgi:hypothetical protein